MELITIKSNSWMLALCFIFDFATCLHIRSTKLNEKAHSPGPPSIFPTDNSTYHIKEGSPNEINKLLNETQVPVTAPLPPEVFPTNQNLLYQNESLENNFLAGDSVVGVPQPTEATETQTVAPIFDSSEVEDVHAEIVATLRNTTTTEAPCNKSAITIQTFDKNALKHLDYNLGGVVLGVVLLLSLCAYICLSLWKKNDEYRSRELLVNDDEYDNFDHRFELMNDDSNETDD